MEEPTKQVIDVISFGTVIGTISAILPPISLYLLLSGLVYVYGNRYGEKAMQRKKRSVIAKVDSRRMMTNVTSTTRTSSGTCKDMDEQST
ncbi:MAG: hypothetical protein CM15mV72_360 [uncultured marine virus]|nr:MAG: hypothetical protein CM15mV72_360 [uncultured marine virus]